MDRLIVALRALQLRLRRWRCRHAVYIDDIRRVPGVPPTDGGEVECACYRCGKVLTAPYGIALFPAALLHRRRPPA